MRSFKYKIRDLSEQQRKIILWLIMILIGTGLFTIYIKNAKEKIEGLDMEKFKDEIRLPSLKEELEKLPKLEMPNIPQEQQQ
jgi:nitrate reductase gamma subunit